MRKLASVQKIADIKPIDGADNIEVARVNNWDVVVKKGEYSIGDYCVYCEIDSFLPIKPEYEFLRKTSFKKMGDKEGFRLKSIRLRGVVSQGLLLPTSVLPQDVLVFDVGVDVTDLLGIEKYEPPIPAELSGVMKGGFPSAVPKTDQERVQNLAKEWDNIKTHTFEVTEKLEGSSLSVILLDGEFNVCSRNLNLKETEGNTFWKVVRENNLEEKMRDHGLDNLAIQAELIGPGIQANIYKLQKHEMRVFDMYDIAKGKYLTSSERLDICTSLGFKHTPVLEQECLQDKTIDEVIAMADGYSVLNVQTRREGLVFKSIQDPSVHFKAVSNQYLLKQND